MIMSDTLPPPTKRRLPLGWVTIAVVAAAGGGLWFWLGQRVPAGDPALLAVAHTSIAAGPNSAPGQASASSQAPPPTSPLVVRAPPTAAPPVPPPSVQAATIPPPTEAAPSRAEPPPAAATPIPPPTAQTEQHAAVVTSAPPPAVAAETAPASRPAPTPDAPASKAENTAIKPSFDIVRVTPQGEAVLAGRAAPGAKVTVTDNGRTIAEATGDSEGQWVALPDKSLPEGGQQLALSSVAPSGRTATGEAPLLVIVPPAPAKSAAPASASGAPPAAAPTTAVAILTPRNAVPRVLQGLPPAALPLGMPFGVPPGTPAGTTRPGAGRLGLDVVDYDEHGAIRFGGTAPPGATLRAYVDNHAAGEAKTDPDGHWSLDPPDTVAAGDHHIRLDQLAANGRVAARIELPFERTLLAAADVREGRIVVQPRATLWRIARQAYGQGVRYTIIYQANRDQIRDPNRIFPGQIFAIPAQAPTASP